MGWGTTTRGASFRPSASASERAMFSNTVEQRVTGGLPSFSISIPSWTLHDVQDPQSPIPLMMKSASLARSSRALAGAPRFAVSLPDRTTPARA